MRVIPKSDEIQQDRKERNYRQRIHNSVSFDPVNLIDRHRNLHRTCLFPEEHASSVGRAVQARESTRKVIT